MTIEHVLVALIVGVGVIPLIALGAGLTASRRVVTTALVGLWLLFPIAIVVLAFAFRQPIRQLEAETFRPIEVKSDDYIGSSACQACHPHQHATWHASFHRTMTQVATPESVLAPTDGEYSELHGIRFRLLTEGDEVWAEMNLPRGAPSAGTSLRVSRRVAMTTGSHHMQVYWYPFSEENRLLGMFPFVYLKEQARWIPRGAAFLQPSYSLDDELGRWNQTCIVCHTTFGRMRPDQQVDGAGGAMTLDPNVVDSHVAELGISCEACHGPGRQHAQANRNPARRYQQHLTDGDDPTIVNPVKLPHDLESQVCGQCHSVQFVESMDPWSVNGFAYRPGDDLIQSKDRAVFRVRNQPTPSESRLLAEHPDFVQDHFWSDGMVRISGREYNGLIESPCYVRGQLSCLSCHQLHQDPGDSRELTEWSDDQLSQGMGSNTACQQCHRDLVSAEAVANHTHHPADSSGSLCYNCHMPFTTYGLLKAIRSHRIDVPSVEASRSTGRPNACNQCHLDKTLGWTSGYLTAWYGIASPELSDDEQSISAAVLWLLKGDAGQRALMAWSFGWSAAQQVSGTDWLVPYLIQLLEDPYAAVRYIAECSLRTVSGYEDFDYDFIGSTQLLELASQRLLDEWSKTGAVPNPHVLIDSQGRLMRGLFGRLLNERDDRPIVLVE